jgi:hypothetical protein
MSKRGQWITKRQSRRHDCAQHLPDAPAGNEGDKWVCPKCGRRWGLAHKAKDGWGCSAEFAEGVSTTGPDRSIYWRPFRTRFIGRLGA